VAGKAKRGSDLVTASEIARFAYCPEQWRLRHRVGLLPENRAALEAGNRHHWWKAVAEQVAGRAIGIGRALVVVAVLLLVLSADRGSAWGPAYAWLHRLR
jgi:hypothetical protein